MLRGRARQITYLYDDPGHPDRVTGHLESPAWTEEDRALLLGLAQYETTLCPGCGEPKALAWHSHMEGFYEAHSWVCHACTAQAGTEVPYTVVRVDEDLPQSRIEEFPPFDLTTTTTAPSEAPPTNE